MSFTAKTSALCSTKAPAAGTRRASVCAAAAPQRVSAAGASTPESVRLADSVGLTGSEEGLFGFKPFPELWVGRLAMLGFAAGAGDEMVTGVPTLRQLGLITPNPDLFLTLSLLIGGVTLFATGRTLYRLQSGDMTLREFGRYANFFGLSAERTAMMEAAARKREGDFLGADKPSAIDAAKAEGTIADDLLAAPVGQSTPLSAEATAASAAAAAYAAMPTLEEIERAFAKEVELTNGRWAMLGFAALILVEAQSGLGLVGQLEAALKLAGVLGPHSGF